MHDDISIHIAVLFMQLWVLHVIVTYISITDLECFFYSVINYVQKNSTNTVKFDFPGSDIVWCKKPNVNVAK